MESLESLLARVEACDICRAHLPLGPRPVVRIGAAAKILIIGQAPGTRVHETGVPWNDPSGDRLREWLDLERDTFYDTSKIAIMPTGFCYPGRDPRGGDLPPRPECAPTWHALLRAHMTNIRLTLLVGMHAQAFCLGAARKRTMTETVRAWQDYGPDVIPTPHPSWRTTAWARKNPWFEAELVPEIRRRVADLAK